MKEKFNPLSEKFFEAEKKKENEIELKTELQKKEEEQRSEKMADLAVKSAFGEDVFERPDKELKDLGAAAKKESKENASRTPYIYQEIDRLGERLVFYKNKAKNSNSAEAKAVYEEKVKFFREELEKAKAARDRIKEKNK